MASLSDTSTMLSRGFSNIELEQVKNFIKKLTEKEQLVIALHYQENLSFEEIAHILKVSKARASEIHSRAIKQIRKI